MKRLLVGDPHIDEESISEIREIFEEISSYEADELYILGDFYDKKHPTSKEIHFGTGLITFLKTIYPQVYLLKGNHDQLDTNISSIDYLEWLPTKILSDEVKIGDILLGHFFVDKSEKAFNNFRYKLEDLEKQYKLIILGHQHSFQILSKQAYHLGSIRYVSYGEVYDKCKKILIIDDFDNSLEFKELEDVIPMVEVTNSADLDKLEPRTKVQLLINNFDTFKKEINTFGKWKDKFVKFKVKPNYSLLHNIDSKKLETKILDWKESFNKWLNNIVDEDIKKELKEVFE